MLEKFRLPGARKEIDSGLKQLSLLVVEYSKPDSDKDTILRAAIKIYDELGNKLSSYQNMYRKVYNRVDVELEKIYKAANPLRGSGRRE
jgi:hypothetical protein